MTNYTIGYIARVALLVLMACAPARADLYVSPQGDDGQSGVGGCGTKQRPLQTLEAARDAVRQHLAENAVLQREFTVWLGEGTYNLGATFELTAADSGSDCGPVVYRAMPGQEVRLTGGRQVPSDAFRVVNDTALLERMDEAAEGNVVAADLRALDIDDLGTVAPGSNRAELFFNDKPLTLARWPNEGFDTIVDVIGQEPMKVHGIAGDRIGKFTYAGQRPSRWTEEDEVWLQGYWFWDWSDQYQQIASIDVTKRTIELKPPYHGYGYRKGQRFYAVNLLAELDSPGEWYLDPRSATLYLWPPEPLEGARIVFSMLHTPLISLNETSNVVLRGLTLETTRGSAVAITGGANNLIAGCTIRNTGTGAITIRGGKNNGAVACDIYQTGSHGISLSGGDRHTLTPAGNYAVNNHIHHFARLKRTYAAALHLAGVGNRVAHNLIHDAPHMAIGFGGNENVMEFNEIHDVCRETGDVGVFYTGRDWTVRGNVIRHNFIHHVSGPGLHGAQGVYLDDCASGTTVVGNVIYQTARAMLIGGGRDNLIENNVMVGCKESIRYDNRGLNWMSYHVTPDGIMPQRLKAIPYQTPPWSTRYPKLLDLLADEPGSPKGNTIRYNLVHASGPMNLAKEVRDFGIVTGNLTTEEDPGFNDAETMDFRLRDDAPVLRELPHFTPIPLDRIGLRRDKYRSHIQGK